MKCWGQSLSLGIAWSGFDGNCQTMGFFWNPWIFAKLQKIGACHKFWDNSQDRPCEKFWTLMKALMRWSEDHLICWFGTADILWLPWLCRAPPTASAAHCVSCPNQKNIGGWEATQVHLEVQRLRCTNICVFLFFCLKPRVLGCLNEQLIKSTSIFSPNLHMMS